jgi:MFS superfamily sulfate permease-like transporter
VKATDKTIRLFARFVIDAIRNEACHGFPRPNTQRPRRELEEPGDDAESSRDAELRRRIPRDVDVYEINGPFFFGAAERFGARHRWNRSVETGTS